jgi:hypothetical protein
MFQLAIGTINTVDIEQGTVLLGRNSLSVDVSESGVGFVILEVQLLLWSFLLTRAGLVTTVTRVRSTHRFVPPPETISPIALTLPFLTNTPTVLHCLIIKEAVKANLISTTEDS